MLGLQAAARPTPSPPLTLGVLPCRIRRTIGSGGEEGRKEEGRKEEGRRKKKDGGRRIKKEEEGGHMTRKDEGVKRKGDGGRRGEKELRYNTNQHTTHKPNKTRNN